MGAYLLVSRALDLLLFTNFWGAWGAKPPNNTAIPGLLHHYLPGGLGAEPPIKLSPQAYYSTLLSGVWGALPPNYRANLLVDWAL